jgi:hypothetical protein
MAQSQQVEFCHKCGKRRLATEPICGHCGAPWKVVIKQTAPTNDPNAPLTPESARSTIMGTLGMLAVCGLGGYGVLSSIGPPHTTDAPASVVPSFSVGDLPLQSTTDATRRALGDPDRTQEFHDADGDTENWYYGDWQLVFRDGRLASKNRY